MAWYKMKRFTRIMRIKRKRKSSSKSDKGLELNDTDSELGSDSMATRSQAKMSLLSGTSFCCASGQKEDYLPEAKIIPPKKRPPNFASKQVHESSAPNTPLVPPSKGFLKNRRGKIIESHSEDTISQASEIGFIKLSHEDVKIRQPGDSRLRPPDQRGRNTPSSPHRKISRDPLPFHRENSETKKLSDVNRKLRKDASPRAIPKEQGSGKKLKDNAEPLDNCPPKETGNEVKSSGKIPSSKCGKSESNSSICNGPENVFHPNSEALEKIDLAKNSTYSICDASGMLPSSDIQDSMDSGVNNSISFDKSSDGVHPRRQNTQDTMDSIMTDSDVMKNSHDSDDFDCPCCDRTTTLVDGPTSDTEIHVFTSCEVVAQPSQNVQGESGNVNQKELALQSEVEALKRDLETERMKLRTQQNRLQHVEEELAMMGQLKNELEKEKELRKIAEDKLLEVLDHEKRMEAQRRENEKRMESKGTQKDDPDTNASGNSPLMMGYESRVRRYQTYITKLEKDNLSLVNELKKFKDMSPSSQEDQAKLLIEKLGEIQRNSHQQQLQYESCLDEVANRLVHTLLVQKAYREENATQIFQDGERECKQNARQNKVPNHTTTKHLRERLEEECKVLHLRVEQLEQENGTLMELIDDDKNENVIKTPTEDEINLESASSKVQNKLPSHHPITSSPAKKISTTRKPSISSEERTTEPLKSTNASSAKSSEPKSPVTSPVSPTSKAGHSSKIPAFSSSKPVVVRKKSKTESQPAKPRNEIHPKEPTSPTTVPNLKSPSSVPSSRTKMPVSSETPKGTSVKRKRLSRNGSPAEKSMKDSKQRMKTSHARWDQRRTVPEDLTSLCKSSKGDISPIEAFPRQQQIWSFNCEVDNEIAIPESSRKIADSINAFHKKLDEEGNEQTEDIDKQNLNTSDAPASIDGGNRTRDEGYSTMSSDLQPDSVADTTVSEPEHSATFIASEKELRCISDDSVTECLDGSMCSSSDSGFGPLHLVANSKSSADFLEEERNKAKELFKSAQDVPRNISTVRHKEQIASVKPTIRNNNPPSKLTGDKELCNKPVSICDNFINSEPNCISQRKTSTEELKLSPMKSKNILENFDASLQSSSPQKKFDYTSMLDYWNYPKAILDITSHGNTWHLGPKRSSLDDQIVFCSRHSYIDDNIFDEKVETAEKATLTEPEEAMWREKALAPFIDESIWSLYSSEGDIRVKHFPLEPLLSEPSSLDKLITDCSPCIIITEDVDDSAQSDLAEFTNPLLSKTSNNSSVLDINESCEKFRSGLERVASDTVLYLKDAIHELEDSMHRGLKSSKNVSALHNNSGSESEASPSGFKPELLLNLESAMLGQSRLVWPSPTRSSSTSSLQSSTSFHVISDEMDDVDLLRTSRKGSRDPDLSSASDAEGENVEHKDFVERWLQNEVSHSNTSKITVSQLEPVEEAAEFTPPPVRRTSLPLPITPPNLHPRARFMSYPQTSSSFMKQQPTSTKCNAAHPQQNSVGCTVDGSTEDVEFKGVDSEVKEFNGDFYKLCSIGSLRSLDHFSPAKTQDAQKRLLSESPSLSRKTSGLANLPSNGEKHKPTGLVKPTRPITLIVNNNNTPNVPDHFKSNNMSPQKNKNISASTDSDQKAKTTQVPSNTQNSVFQKQSSPSSRSLPTAAGEQNLNCRSPKLKVPTKIVFKSSASRRRQHSKRDATNERQNQLKEGCGTAWIHLQANPELSDPMARINLLDSLKAPTSSSGSSTDEEEEVLVIQTNSHLHRICRERRQKVKASANNPLFEGKKRSSIMGRHELFYRFGDKEREAIACFDFLEELPTGSSVETLNILNSSSPHELLPIHRTATPPTDLYPAGRDTLSNKERISFLSPTASNKLAAFGNQSSITRSPFSSYKRMRLPNLWNQPLSHNMSSSTLNSQDCELLDHVSLSDSCAESYSSTPESYEDAS